MSNLLTHAHEFEDEEFVDRIRSRLRTYVEDGGQGRWGFALYRRRELKPGRPSVRIIGFVTVTESAALTSALLASLPQDVWLERVPTPIQLVSISPEPELRHEPLPAVLLRFRAWGLTGTKALTAHALPPLGIVFMTRCQHRPLGWPP